MNLLREKLPELLGVIGWIVVVVVAVGRAQGAIGTGGVGLDLHPLYGAGSAVRSGHSVYDVSGFVYPPTAALIGLLFTVVSFHRAIILFAYLELGILSATMLLAYKTVSRSRWALLIAAIVAVALLKGDVVVDDAWLENASVLLVLPLLQAVAKWPDCCMPMRDYGYRCIGAPLLDGQMTGNIRPLLVPIR